MSTPPEHSTADSDNDPKRASSLPIPITAHTPTPTVSEAVEQRRKAIQARYRGLLWRKPQPPASSGRYSMDFADFVYSGNVVLSAMMHPDREAADLAVVDKDIKLLPAVRLLPSKEKERRQELYRKVDREYIEAAIILCPGVKSRYLLYLVHNGECIGSNRNFSSKVLDLGPSGPSRSFFEKNLVQYCPTPGVWLDLWAFSDPLCSNLTKWEANQFTVRKRKRASPLSTIPSSAKLKKQKLATPAPAVAAIHVPTLQNELCRNMTYVNMDRMQAHLADWYLHHHTGEKDKERAERAVNMPRNLEALVSHLQQSAAGDGLDAAGQHCVALLNRLLKLEPECLKLCSQLLRLGLRHSPDAAALVQLVLTTVSSMTSSDPALLGSALCYLKLAVDADIVPDSELRPLLSTVLQAVLGQFL